MEQKIGIIRFWKDNFGFREIGLNAFTEIKREDFIPEDVRNSGYQDMPLPLLRGKTISQPTSNGRIDPEISRPFLVYPDVREVQV